MDIIEGRFYRRERREFVIARPQAEAIPIFERRARQASPLRIFARNDAPIVITAQAGIQGRGDGEIVNRE